MVHIQEQGDTVVFTVEGWHKLWALRSELRIPRANILGARRDPEASKEWGIRALGTSVPGILKAGTFYFDSTGDNKPTFLDVQHRENTVVIDLQDEEYNRLIIEVADPAAVVALFSPVAI
ncbi:hypothetical protein FNT36_16985 [Hymenobacter setariae]|uniref:Uncharacterized protein n=1 Tax=Hymenobacter setariae TaxID=2594794 RepID=A0A558BS59_9BACT|nr:hypothetical protein [Hymenobacter setariae]TVT39350.1 hypothetical protein FNT36_16985 [Hymenobacter setariae]